MARARNIKPSFFEDDIMGGLEPIARLLYIGMWTIADYRGNLEYRPLKIKAKCLPYDNCDIEALLINLECSRFITIYTVEGQKYIHINSFDKDQNPHPNEKKAGTEIPDFIETPNEINELKQDGKNREQNGTDRADSGFLIPDSGFLIPDPLTPPSGEVGQASQADGETLSATIPTGLAAAPAVVVKVIPERRKGQRSNADALAVFEYWQKAMGHPHAKLDDKRAKAINARLSDGYSLADLCLAVDGCKLSPFHMGQNDSKAIHDDIELICRNGPNVDRFIKQSKVAPSIVPTGTTNQQKTMDAVQRYLEKHGHVA